MVESLSSANWRVEIAEGTEICKDGVLLKDIECEKNPGHVNMVPFTNLQLSHLPENHRTEKTLDRIRRMGRRVVKLKVETATKEDKGTIAKLSNQICIFANKNFFETDCRDIKDCVFEIQLKDSLKKCRGEKFYKDYADSVLFTFLPTLDLNEFKECTSSVVILKVQKYKYGTGFVGKYKDQYTIKTNNHVVNTDDEIRKCAVYFDSDSCDEDAIACQGVELQWTCPFRDVTLFSFNPIPEFLEEMDIVNFGNLFPTVKILYKDDRRDITCVCSYEDKNDALLYGINININSPDVRDIKLIFADHTLSYPSSHYLLFDPIPKNIDSLIQSNFALEIKVHATIVAGTCVNVEDKRCIKLHEPITIEESKQLILHFPDNVISYGIGVYFENRDYRDFFSVTNDSNPERVYFFDLKPRTKEMDLFLHSLRQLAADIPKTEDFCVIGYPHGAIKTVSFGHHMAYKYTEIINVTGDGEEGQFVPCRLYSCPTCPGCSGAPVFMLASLDAKKTFGTTHFMGSSEDTEINGITNRNAAWSPASLLKTKS